MFKVKRKYVWYCCDLAWDHPCKRHRDELAHTKCRYSGWHSHRGCIFRTESQLLRTRYFPYLLTIKITLYISTLSSALFLASSSWSSMACSSVHMYSHSYVQLSRACIMVIIAIVVIVCYHLSYHYRYSYHYVIWLVLLLLSLPVSSLSLLLSCWCNYYNCA